MAKECHVKTGKWMLFPPPEEVNAVWQRVVEATATGQLGSSAKVATDGGVDNNALGPGPGPGGGRGRPRLVCVYTEDFDDEGDVVRVLKKLVEMGLVNRKEAGRQARGLYYKCGKFQSPFLFLVYISEIPVGILFLNSNIKNLPPIWFSQRAPYINPLRLYTPPYS